MEDITREWVKENDDECCGAYCSDAGCCVYDTLDIKNKEYG